MKSSREVHPSDKYGMFRDDSTPMKNKYLQCCVTTKCDIDRPNLR